MNRTVLRKIAVFSLLLALLPCAGAAAAQTPARTYLTPEEAAAGLAEATKAGNLQELRAILGPASGVLLESGDPAADAADRKAFSAAYAKGHFLVPGDSTESRYFLEIGDNNWRFPVPLVRDKNGRWHFDGKEGQEALLALRIGHNELSAIQVCLAFADAQREYWRRNPEQSPAPHYAARIASSPGKRDGLYWESGDGEQSPLGALAAAAESKGYGAPKGEGGTPYFGYRYRILAGQGGHAPGGAVEYTENGRMVRGFALLAYPDRYGLSGVMTFMINQDGVVYEKNLGQKTAEQAGKIASFDPDATWRPVNVR